MGSVSTKKALKQSTMSYIFNGASILFVLLMIFLFIETSVLDNRVNKAYEDSAALTENTNRFMDGSAYLTNEMRSYAATGNAKHYDNYLNEANNLKNRETGVANLRQIGITDEEEQIILKMAALSNQLVLLEADAIEMVKAGNRDAALEDVYGDEYENVILEIDVLKEQFFASINKRSEENLAETQERSRWITNISYVFLGVIVFFQIMNLIITIRKIIRPIKKTRNEMGEFAAGNLHGEFNMVPDTSEIGQLVEAIKLSKLHLSDYINEIDTSLAKMAAGDFDIHIAMDFVGDFEEIKESIEKFATTMSATIIKVREAAEQVAASAGQISDSAQALAQGTTEQAGTMEELTASLHQVDTQIHATTEHTHEAVKASQATAHDIESCNGQMEKLMLSMREIDEMAGQIKTIIKTIDDIAFQTNLLALNAAVEAARAGEAGKGFAVVADEVSNLAGKSAEAAKDTAELIEKTVQAVSGGSKMAEDTADNLQKIVKSAAAISALIDNISEASEIQEAEIDQITVGMDQIAQVVTSNSATSEESAASAEELSGLAQMLESLMEGFNLRSEGGGMAKPPALPPHSGSHSA